MASEYVLYDRIRVIPSTGTKAGWWALCPARDCAGQGRRTSSGEPDSREACESWAQNHMRHYHWTALSQQ